MFRRTPGNVPQPDKNDLEGSVMKLYNYIRQLEEHINNIIDNLNSMISGGGDNGK